MTRFDLPSIIIGSIAGGLFSFISTYANLSGFGILLSNIVGGFVAVLVSKTKEDYILISGVSGILSSFIMLIIAFLLPFSPLGFSNLNVFGFISVAVSISGGGFILGMIGGLIAKKVSG